MTCHGLKVKHMYLTANETLGEHGVYIESATRDRHLHVGTGCVLEAYKDGRPVMRNRMFHAFGEQAVEFGDVPVTEGETVRLVKYVSMYTERECPAYALHTTIKRRSTTLWRTVWKQNFVSMRTYMTQCGKKRTSALKGDPELNQAVRFNIFH